ncbi:DUF899 domain-containing protein [Solimonas fluminis]|uniref:DUF899 domain-containing protein n=1 Tax=Solimonas fluminis TaxID=2086571 RepID=A0A2S5TH23_9GAMM|nr:thioredoxin family protein [Solimonas fluminis]PPE74261.1 DUF899 domain-containing protein [Solimonas fluminis]
MNIAVSGTPFTPHPVVSREQWLAERLGLLQREKEMSRLRDELARARRTLPWVRVTQDYVFDTPEGPRRLGELFEGRRQLVVQHFMLAPGAEQGCTGCSFMADHIDGTLPHLQQRDITLLAVSRAPLAEIERFRARMGWRFRWVSSQGSSFNYDFGVSFTPEARAGGEARYNYGSENFQGADAPGISVFFKDDAGQVFHTYSTYGRGVELMMGTYELIDITPRGRDEAALPYPMAWVKHHDRYAQQEPLKAGCCHDKA